KASKNALPLAFAFADIGGQLDSLVYKGFMFRTPEEWLHHYPRYLRAVQLRLEKAPLNVQKDRQHIEELKKHLSAHQDKFQKEGEAKYWANREWQLFRWMIEELRVSLFAQELRTIMPVSDKRLNAQWQLVQ